MKIKVEYLSGAQGEFGPITEKNLAMQFLAILAGRPDVVSATIEEPRIIG